MIFGFDGAPPDGTTIKLDEQIYELREARPASRNDGTPTMLLDWETTCPCCADDFTITTGLAAKSLNRRCPDCKNPTKTVKGRRGRKLKVEIIFP